MPITILPLMSVSEQILKDLKDEVGNALLSSVVILQPLKALPDSTYDKTREQYDADKLVKYLRQQAKDAHASKLLAIGSMDMFVGDMSFVFGAAEKGGGICAVSLYRLDQRFYSKHSSYETFKERAVKEAVHELGHCYGLDHCKDKRCVMAFSNHIVAVDEKSRFFCEACREKLRKAL